MINSPSQQNQKLSSSNLIEKPDLTLGFMPLTDCAPLVVAKELGYFAKFGLKVTLAKQNSWASMRDKLAANVLDAGQLLAPMPLAGSLNIDKQCHDFIAPFVLSRNGNAITISRELHEKSKYPKGFQQPVDASELCTIVAHLKTKGKKLTFATVYSYSCHYLQLISYFEQGGIDKNDINIVVIPPASMVAALRNNEIDGFCVGGPYNAKAVREGVGVTVATSIDVWPDLPEKVLGFKRQWYLENPNTTYALINALSLACRWLDNVPNRFEAARFLCHTEYIDMPIDVIAPSLLGSCLTCKDEEPRSVKEYNRFISCDDTFANRPDVNEITQLQSYFNIAFDNVETILTGTDLSNIYSSEIYELALAWKSDYFQ
jgi:two-component system, oxyanion-binding sensor